MLKSYKKIQKEENNLYNNILLLSRNKIFYTVFNLSDTFQNRIHLMFIHISFLFIKIKQDNNSKYKNFYQKMFDLIFKKIEINMREIGYGDTVINKNMKLLVKNFYNILLYCETFDKKAFTLNNVFFLKYLDNNYEKDANIEGINKYFMQYNTFCIDLRPDNVLKGDLKFNYK